MFKPNTRGSNKFRKQHRLIVTLSVITKYASPRANRGVLKCELRKPLVRNSLVTVKIPTLNMIHQCENSHVSTKCSLVYR